MEVARNSWNGTSENLFYVLARVFATQDGSGSPYNKLAQHRESA